MPDERPTGAPRVHAAATSAGAAKVADRIAAAAPLLVVAYFTLNAVLRTLTPGGLGVDEAEAMLHGQRFALAYGPQPPLYGWLQGTVFALVGPGKLGLALLKNAILALAFISVWATARLGGADARFAFAAALAMALVPGIAWEAQRALAHTPLALATAAAALLAFVHARRSGRLGAHLLLGLALAAAALAYWTTAFIGFGIAAALVFRQGSPWAHSAVTLATATLLVAPTALWYAVHGAAVSAASSRLSMNATNPIESVLAVGEGVVATLALPVVVLGLLLARPGEQPGSRGPSTRVLTDLTFVVGAALAAFVLLALLAGIDEVKERYLTPVLFIAPMLVLAWGSARLTAPRTMLLASLVGIVLLGVSAGLQWNWRIGDDEPPPNVVPFAGLAAKLSTDVSTLLVDSEWVGGNLLLAERRFSVLTPENASLCIAVVPPVRLVWLPAEGAEPPPALLALFEARVGRAPVLGPIETISAPWPPRHTGVAAFTLHTTLAR